MTVSELRLTARAEATAQEINGYVTDTKAEFLLIGAPSRRSQMDFNVDSIASQLLRTSRIPVLTNP